MSDRVKLTILRGVSDILSLEIKISTYIPVTSKTISITFLKKGSTISSKKDYLHKSQRIKVISCWDVTTFVYIFFDPKGKKSYIKLYTMKIYSMILVIYHVDL